MPHEQHETTDGCGGAADRTFSDGQAALLFGGAVFGSSWFAPGLIVLVALLAYGNSFTVPFHLDDTRLLEQSVLSDPGDIPGIWRAQRNRFLSRLTLAANLAVHGVAPLGFHVVNLTVHIAAALLVWRLVLLLTVTPALVHGPSWGYRRHVAVFSALVFVSHPLQTQAVTYIIQRDASLATVFYLGSVCSYLKARLGMLGGESGNEWGAWYVLALLSGLAGIFTKEICATLPAALLLCEVSFFPRHIKRSWIYVMPFFGVVLCGPLSMLLKHTSMRELINVPRIGRQAANIATITRGTDQLPRSHYLLTQFRVVARYVRLVVLPYGQSIDHHVRFSRSLWEPWTFAAALFLSVLLAGAVALLRTYRLMAFAILWFFLTLVVESTVIPLPDVMFEHRLYLPMVGFAILLPALAFRLIVSPVQGNVRERSATGATGIPASGGKRL